MPDKPAVVWRVEGTRHGEHFTVYVEAANHNDAVRKASHAPHMLVVESCVLAQDFSYTYRT